jgi:hypothetical protein
MAEGVESHTSTVPYSNITTGRWCRVNYVWGQITVTNLGVRDKLMSSTLNIRVHGPPLSLHTYRETMPSWILIVVFSTTVFIISALIGYFNATAIHIFCIR